MTRLDAKFADLKATGRKGLIGFMTAGDPDPETGLEIMAAACDAGLDALEIGVPFSDPTSDGPVIQEAAGRALAAGTTLAGVLDMTARLRARTDIPLILFSYYNPILQYGPAQLYTDAAAAGLDGFLIVDLPPEEAGELTGQWPERGLPLIRLVAPTTPEQRTRQIVAGAGGFLYLITRTGVTGEGLPDPAMLARRVASLRDLSGLPVALGFGIRNADDVKSMAPLADAVIVGSALVEKVAEGGTPAEMIERVRKTVRDLRAAL